MTFTTTLKTPVWIAIIVGGSVFLIAVVAAVTIFLFARRRRRQAVSERRLSRYPGGHLSDADLAHLPSVRAVLRKSNRKNPYGRGWVTAASHDSLIRRSILQIPSTHNHISAAVTSNASWKPVPRQMVRSKPMLLCSMKALPLEPIIERPTNSKENSPNDASGSIVLPSVPDAQLESEVFVGDPCDFQDIDLEISPGSQRPNLLFHEQQRSYSGGVTDKSTQGDQKDCLKSDVPGQSENFRGLNTIATRPNLQRSFSVLSQQSGHVPNERLPSPTPSLPRRVQALREYHDHRSKHSSLASSASIDSSILNDGDSNPLSSSDTDYASVCVLSPFKFEASKRSPHIFDGESNPWNWSNIKPTSSSQSTIATIQPQIVSQSSFQASVAQHKFSKEASNGLSLSHVDKHIPPWNPSITLRKPNVELEQLEAYNNTSANTFKQNEDNSKMFTSTSESSLRRHVHSVSEQDSGRIRNKPASTSILQDASGNQASPFKNFYETRPSSIATDQPFRWDAETLDHPVKVSAIKDRGKGHKRQPCQRIVVTTPLVTPPKFTSLMEEPDETRETTLDPAIHGLLAATPGEYQMPPRPPSCATFDPHIKTSPQRNDKQPEDRYYSATMSMYNFHNGVYDTSLDSTPTRKPSRRRQPCNSQKSALANHCDLEWPLVSSVLSKPTLTETASSNTTQARSVDFRSPIPSSDTRPPSFLFPFPAPPKAPDWHRPPARLIQGPRTAPPRSRSPRRRSPRQLSPLRNVTRCSSRNSPQNLLASAVALRRMNSELSTFDINERKQYVNMGGGSPVMEDSPGERFLPTSASSCSPTDTDRDKSPFPETGITFEWEPNASQVYDRLQTVVDMGEEDTPKADERQAQGLSWYDPKGFLKE